MKLTPTQRRVLTTLRDADDSGDYYSSEIVCDGECWLGSKRVARRTVQALVEMVLISYENSGGAEHYTINGSGRATLEDESVIDRIQTALLTNTPCDERGYPIAANAFSQPSTTTSKRC